MTPAPVPFPGEADAPPSALHRTVPIARVTRGGFVESVHHGLAVVTEPDGGTLLALGDTTGPVLPRSCLKPVQALAMVRLGLDLPPEQLALVCSSHSGDPGHLDGVRATLAAGGLRAGDLETTPSFPYGVAERDAWVAAGRGPEPIGHDCSGKHAGMLRTCLVNGWPTRGYLEPSHPLQRAILATVADEVGPCGGVLTVDGCGAPVPAVPLDGLARAIGRIAAGADDPDRRRVADAMRAHPHLVGGAGREATVLMEALPGVLAKDGAEAVFVVGLPDGRGIAVKVADGSTRAFRAVLRAVLARLGLDGAALGEVEILGHGQPVGTIEAVV